MVGLGLTKSIHVPQFFYENKGVKLVLISAKIVYDIKETGSRKQEKSILE